MRQRQQPDREPPKPDTDPKRGDLEPRMIEARQVVQEYIGSLRAIIHRLNGQLLN